jgi:squalene-hopene/tetraprenyl-beta-curcumene cyclase
MARLPGFCITKILMLAAASAMLGCGSIASERTAPSRMARIDRSLAAAVTFLIRQQSSDGAWRPDTYGVFKDGPSLTPLVLQALLATAPAEKRDLGLRKGVNYLANMVQADGRIDAGPRGLSYPVYTAAYAVLVLSQPCNARYRRERETWLTYLRARQLTEELGWEPADREYGGWGYASGLPRKPKPGEAAAPLTESNLSATTCALSALRAAGVPPTDPALEKALSFVERCQNYPNYCDPFFDDGGFFFIYDDAVRNKAGVAGRDVQGRERYASYGSTTADGLRALLACGLPSADHRIIAARRWLERNFNPADHPGKYARERLGDRSALYFYYCCSVSQAFRMLGLQEMQTVAGRVSWAAALADELLQRQRPDGSWINPGRAVREDEPVLATSFATIALSLCRESLAGN